MQSFDLRSPWAPPVWSRRLHHLLIRPSQWSSLIDLEVDLAPDGCLTFPDCSLQFVCVAGVCVSHRPRRWAHLSQAQLGRCQRGVEMPIPPPPPPPPGPPPPPTFNVVSVKTQKSFLGVSQRLDLLRLWVEPGLQASLCGFTPKDEEE